MATVIKRFLANWAIYDQILAVGMIGQEIETGKQKVGDGVKPWSRLSYSDGTAPPSTGGGTTTPPTTGGGTTTPPTTGGGTTTLDTAGVFALVKGFLKQGANVSIVGDDTAKTLTVSAAGGTGGSGTTTITIASITDASMVGKNLLAATSAANARSAIGAGTSNLAVGTSATDAKRGDYVPTWSELGLVPTSSLPPLAINDVFTVASQTAMLALTAQRGDMAIRTDSGKTLVLASDSPNTLADWKEISAAGSVVSVAGKTGTITLAKGDVGLANVENVAPADLPISTVAQAALDEKVGLADIAPVTGLRMGVQNLNLVPSAGQIAATWEAPSITVGIQGYEVRARTVNGSTLGSWVSYGFIASTVLTTTITGLANSQTYEVEIVPVYAQRSTPSTPALYGDQFAGTSTWTAASGRNAADGTTSRPWSIYSASTTTPAFSIYDGAARASVGNQAVSAVYDAGAPTASKRIRWGWKALLSDVTKRRVGCQFRALGDISTISFWQVYCDAGPWAVRKVVAGASTVMTLSQTVTAAAGDVVEVLPGTTTDPVVVKINGVTIFSGVDTDLAANQYVGVRMQGQASGQTYSQDQTSALDYCLSYAS